MIIKNKAENEAVLSNVGHVGEFRIRNSAKAFGILSSGLYANKIRAIIREYSCNAYDSHVEAGRGHCPFDVHLPNALSPWFAVRDYGVGLDNKQVFDIVTTYFESTKTDTDDLIGGLGLGAKSAFSYTDNFTITAIKAGMKRIYTAFINEQGVPSVAMMFEESTSEATGVEIKLSVNDQRDFYKFREEAEYVFRTFKLKPNIEGVDGFKINETEYTLKDIIPGVHQRDTGWRNNCAIAIMGNISYPIDIPNADAVLGGLAELLSCKLEIEFKIGELDIQASREGLSYIPETIAAIKTKLKLISDALVVRIAADADGLNNEWLRAMYVIAAANNQLTKEASIDYLSRNPSQLINTSTRYMRLEEPKIYDKDLTSWNIRLRGFQYLVGRTGSSPRTLKAKECFTATNSQGQSELRSYWSFPVVKELYIVSNTEGKTGSIERAKNHWKDQKSNQGLYVFVADPIDKAVPMNTAALMSALHGPHNGLVVLDSLTVRPKPVKTVPSVSMNIMRLEKSKGSGYWHASDNKLVWRDAGSITNFIDTKTYYYVPLKGHKPELSTTDIDCNNLVETLTNTKLALFSGIVLHGVRNADLATVSQLSNWVKLEDHIVAQLNAIDDILITSVAAFEIDNGRTSRYDEDIVKHLDAASPYAVMATKLAGMAKTQCNISSVDRLTKIYKDLLTPNTDFAKKVATKTKEFNEVGARYPLLQHTNSWAPASSIAEYIKLVDAVQGI